MSKIALITGAATGIGRGLTQKMDTEGWTVYATYNRRAPDALIANSSERVIPVQCDVSDAASIGRVAERVLQAHSKLDLLVCNAGVAIASGPLEALNVDEFKQMMSINFWAPLHFARALAPALRRSEAGKIINVGSSSVHLLIPGIAGYPISKMAVDTLTRNLRMELSPFGVQACVLHPGAVDTDMNSLGEDLEKAYWGNVEDKELRELYQRVYPTPGTQFNEVKKMPVAAFSDLIYRKILTPKKIKAQYSLGPYATMSRVMFSYLPYGLFETMHRSISRLMSPHAFAKKYK